MPFRILIAGIGNIFLGDDGFGCEVVRQLDSRGFPDGVCVADFATRSLDLAFALLTPRDLVIFVDAAGRDSPPGTLYLIEPEVEERVTAEMHGMDLGKVLALARSMGAQLNRMVIVGCEPASFVPMHDENDNLSALVRAAVPAAIDMIGSLV